MRKGTIKPVRRSDRTLPVIMLWFASMRENSSCTSSAEQAKGTVLAVLRPCCSVLWFASMRENRTCISNVEWVKGTVSNALMLLYRK